MMIDHEALLARAPLFAAMGPDLTRSVVQKSAPRYHERGEGIFQQGDLADSFFFVVEGWIKVFRERESGEQIVIAIFSAGDTFGEAAMFLGGCYPASAETVSPSRVLRIDGAALRRAIVADPQAGFSMLAALSARLRHLMEQIEQLKARSASERIADFLLDQTHETSGAATVALPYEKALIASRLGMQPENFLRAMVKLRDIGVTICRDNVLIKDVGSLLRYAARAVEGGLEEVQAGARPASGGVPRMRS
jgi:CRP-like cAMP-binding protein